MKALHRIGTFMILLVFLLGTTGLSVFHHICRMEHEDRVSVFPGFYTDPGSSCCSDETDGTCCACTANAAHNCSRESFSTDPCCKNVASFFRLEILTLRVEKLSLPALEAGPVPERIAARQCLETELRIEPAAILTFHPPPLSGRNLVNYLHQIKIPARPGIA